MTISRAHPTQPGTLEVHCLGNLDRGDDAVGLRVAPRLAECLASSVTVRAHSGDPLTLIEYWAGLDALICVDAAQSLGAPGRIHRVDYRADRRLAVQPVATTHHFGLADALALAARFDQLPRHVVIFAVEAPQFDLGAALTPAVAQAIPSLIESVVAETQSLGT